MVGSCLFVTVRIGHNYTLGNMAVDNENRRIAGQGSFLGGANSNLSPRLLGEDQVSWAVNATMRGGSIGPRPGFSKIPLQFADNDAQTNFQLSTAKFQGAGVSVTPDGVGQIYCSVGGRIFLIEPERLFKLSDITPDTGASSGNPDIVTFNQAELWTIAQDGKAAPVIIEAGGARRAARETEIENGTVSRYVNGRIWTANRNNYEAGDLVGSSSGTATLGFKDAILKRTENTFLNGGGSFSIPTSSGVITAMVPLNTLDTVLGDGELIILTERTAFATQVPSDRAQWADTSYPIQRNVLSAGCVGPFSAVNVNNDIFFRSHDGIRSLLTARRDFGSPGNTPLSTEMNRLLDRDLAVNLKHTSAVEFDNRLLHTAVGTLKSRGVTHDALAVMDFNPVSSLRGKAPPVWDGAWSGLKFFHIVEGQFSGKSRAFVFTHNETSNEIELWELTKDQTYDYNGSTQQPIEWYLETRAVDFGSPWEKSKLTDFESWWKDLVDDLSVTVYMRPDCNPNWETWRTYADANQYTICSTDASDFDSSGCLLKPQYQPGYRARRAVGDPPKTDETETEPCKKVNTGFSFQFRIQVTGHANLDLIRWYADIEEEPNRAPCAPTTATETSNNECPLSEFPTITLA